MRPSVTEQLEGVQRVLEQVIAPELTGTYPRDILAGVCATLETLAAGWRQVPAFLEWDAQASDALAAALRGENLAGTQAEPIDIEQLEARHRESRAALEKAIAERDDPDAASAELATHFRERAERYPLKTVWRPAAR